MRKVVRFLMLAAMLLPFVSQAQTPCATLNLPFSESFDSTSTTRSCWTIIDADADGNGWTTLYNGADIGIMLSFSYDNSYGALNPDNWLISPKLHTVAGDSLTMQWNVGAGDDTWYAEHYGVYVSTTTTDTSAFTLVNEWTLTGADEEVKVLDLSAYAGQDIYVAFRHFNCTDEFALLIDDVRVYAGSYVPDTLTVTFAVNDTSLGTTLPAPGTYQYITGDTVFFTAIPTGDNAFTGWEIIVGIDTFSLGSSNISYSYLANSLMSYGSITFIANFISCGAVPLPYTEAFESTSATRNCWDLVSNNTSNVGGNNGMGFYNHSGRQTLRFSSYSSASDYNQYAFSPVMSVSSDASILQVSVTYATYGANDKLNFGYVTATDTVWDPTDYTTAGGTDYQTITSVIPANATQVAIHYFGQYSWYAWIDSLIVTELTADYCFAPSDLTVEAATQNSVTLSWSGDAANYAVYNGETLVGTTADTTYTVTGLAAGTAYTFGVQSLCSATDSSIINTIATATACADITVFPYTENFENGLVCWTTVEAPDADGSWNAAVAYSAHSGNHVAASYSWRTIAMNADNWLISPRFDLPATTDPITFSWWEVANASFPDSYSVAISTTTADTSAFTVISPAHEANGTWTQCSVDLTAYAGQSVYVAFHHVDYDENYIYIDDIDLYVGAYVPDTLTVTFATADATMGTTVPAPGTYQYVEGDTVEFRAVANAGYHFVGWVLEADGDVDTLYDANISLYFPASFYIDYGEITFTALFEAGNPDSTTITYAVNNPAMGTINPAPGTYTIYVGDEIEATAIPNAGYHLEAWVLDIYLDGMLYDSDTLYADDDYFENPINVGTLPQSFADYDATLTLTAIFAPGGSDLVIVTFEVNDITMGSVNPSGVQTYAVGTPFTVTATPFDGYRFVSWTTTIDGSTVTVEDAPSTFNDIATMEIDGAVIVANFEPVQGIDDVEADGFQAYSVDGKVVVKGVENMDVNVYDVTGRQIQAIKQSSNQATIDVPAAGVYMVKVGTAVKRVVVIR